MKALCTQSYQVRPFLENLEERRMQRQGNSARCSRATRCRCLPFPGAGCCIVRQLSCSRNHGLQLPCSVDQYCVHVYGTGDRSIYVLSWICLRTEGWMFSGSVNDTWRGVLAVAMSQRYRRTMKTKKIITILDGEHYRLLR